MTRKLASIRRITDIQPIKGADALVVATVDGWKVVVKKDEFKVGDLAVYIEIDSLVPHELAPFLSKGQEPREYNGVKGERLRTIKLRGQVSQGLLIKPEFHELFDALSIVGLARKDGAKPIRIGICEGSDVTDLFGIQKCE